MKRRFIAAIALALASTLAAAQFNIEKLDQRIVRQRANQAAIWGMPVVNFDLMHEAVLKAKGADNQVVFWSRLPDWKNQTLTPNPDSIYVMPFYDTKNGPVVLEIPPADEGTIVGSIDDCWQTALEDVGPAGADQGKGGKYLILPPAYDGAVPEGYIVLRSNNYRGFALLRSILKSGSNADVAKAVAYAKRIKFYPYAQAATAPKTIFVDVVDQVFDSTIRYDLTFFQSLDRMVQYEPWLIRDKAMIDTLKAIGIEKGQPFNPDGPTQAGLRAAIADAHAWINGRYDASFGVPFAEGTRWALPASPELVKGIMSNYADPDSYPLDARAVAYSMAFFSAKQLGHGQFYLMTIWDKDGHAMTGFRDYRLTVPANAPVSLYWSATVYDRSTHALIRDQKRSSRSSQNVDLQKNADGSVDIYFGSKAPAGKESNWVPTNPKGQFEVLFRFYGPGKPLFDKTWKLPDIEIVN